MLFLILPKIRNYAIMPEYIKVRTRRFYMKKSLLILIIFAIFSTLTPSYARTHGTDGEVSGKSVGAAALSLFIWPGIGQAVNKNEKKKNITHAVLGLTGIFRIWSCYDALVDRKGGVWENRI